LGCPKSWPRTHFGIHAPASGFDKRDCQKIASLSLAMTGVGIFSILNIKEDLIMKKILTLLFAMFLVTFMFNISGATVIYFDDITTSSSSFIPSDYQGLNWGGDNHFGVIIDNGGYSYQTTFENTYGSPSGEYAAYNSYGVTVSLSSDAIFDFTGAYFTSWAYNDDFGECSSTSILLSGYNGSRLIGTVSMSLSANQYDWLQADLVGINTLIFEASGDKKWWLMDNFTYNETASPVPESATILLLGIGLIGLVGASKVTGGALGRYVASINMVSFR